MIKKLPSGRWQVDIQPGGRGQKRIRNSFDAKPETQRFERWILSQHDSGTPVPHLKKDRKGSCSESCVSHFRMNGGDILTLQKILGHSSIGMTMRYAHLAPTHFKETVEFTPKLQE